MFMTISGMARSLPQHPSPSKPLPFAWPEASDGEAATPLAAPSGSGLLIFSRPDDPTGVHRALSPAPGAKYPPRVQSSVPAIPVVVVVDEGTFGHEALADELGAAFVVHVAVGLADALSILPALERPLVLVPRALDPMTGDRLLGELARHRFDLIGLLMLDDDVPTVATDGVHILIRRPLRPGALRLHLEGAARLRHAMLASQAEARRLNEDLSRLRDGLRHDLRGQLQAVVGLASLVLELERPLRAPDDEILDFVARIAQSGERLTHFADRLGDWLNAARRPVEEGIVDLGELLLEVVADARANHPVLAARRTPTPIAFDPLAMTPADPTALAARVPGDARLLQRALATLVGHLLETVGRAEVTLRKDGDAWTFAVRDHSPRTFPRAQLDRAFRLFERLMGGDGLALAYVAKVAERHGGQVAATPHPDGGHELTLTLPTAARAIEDEVATTPSTSSTTVISATPSGTRHSAERTTS
jgi:signal transduction histidine kinase